MNVGIYHEGREAVTRLQRPVLRASCPMKQDKTNTGSSAGDRLEGKAPIPSGSSLRSRTLLERIMLFVALGSASLLLLNRAEAADWYVRPAATGANTGKDWNNAWSLGTIAWSNLVAGDTVWIAGGTYSSSLTVGKGGSSANPIRIYRVRASDAAPVAAPGWTSGFDSLATITGSPGISVPASSAVTIDGRSPYGIKIVIPATGGDGVKAAQSASIDSLTLANIEVLGPYTSTATVGVYGVNIAPSTNTVTNLRVASCRVRGISEAFRASNWNGAVVERCVIADTANDGVDHEDVIYSYPCSNVTFRYNTITNSPNDGLFFEFGGATNFRFYGNVYYNSTYLMIKTKSPGNYGPIYIYNNVFHSPSNGTAHGIVSFAGTTNGATEVFNNIFFNTTNSAGDGGPVHSDYNAYNYTSLGGYGWPSSEAHSLTFTGDPFVNPAGGDYHLNATSAGTFKNKGKTLTTDGYINVDADGNTRGADGAWDIGAYEIGGTATAPSPPKNLRIITP